MPQKNFLLKITAICTPTQGKVAQCAFATLWNGESLPSDIDQARLSS